MNIPLEKIERITKEGLIICGIIILAYGIIKAYYSAGIIGGGITFIAIIGFVKESFDIVKILIEGIYSKVDKKRFLLVEPNNIMEY
jgi:hypothetical protein